MADTVLELFPTHDLVNYASTVGIKQYPLTELFPVHKFATDDIWVINGQTNIPEIAHIHGEDTESEIGTRSGEKTSVEPYILKRKMLLKGSEIRKLNMPRNADELAYLKGVVYNDATNLVNSVNVALELQRVKALTENGFTIGTAMSGSGSEQKFDYDLPTSSQLATVNFADPSIDPIEVLETWVDSADFDVTRGILSKKAFNAIRTNPNTVKRVNGLNSQFSLKSVMASELNNFLTDNNMPELVVYTQKYKENGVTKNMIADGRLALFGDGIVGETAFGITEEEAALGSESNVDLSTIGNVALTSWHESTDPIVNGIKATALAVPTIAQKNTLLQASVLG